MLDPNTEDNQVWPPQPQYQKPPLSEKTTTRLDLIIQSVLGILAGILLNPLIQSTNLFALARFHITWVDDGEGGTYIHPEIERATIWGVFFLLAICFLALRRKPGLSRFATTALVTHCLIGGLYSLLMASLVGFHLS